MNYQFATRMSNTSKSFIREILKVTKDPAVISLAGGLPNPAYFPVQEVAQASARVLGGDEGAQVLQYSTTEGYLPLREYIADRYQRRYGLAVSPEEILITNGSQQGLDLIGKLFLDKGDPMVLERPGYLGAIQSFSLYEPTFLPVTLAEEGLDLAQLEQTLQQHKPKLFYTVPNFQNPSGITYSQTRRAAVAGLLKKYGVTLVEDDPYGELRFTGQDLPAINSYLENTGIMLGTFSKVVAPGMRLGWIYANKTVMEKLITAKQASDLHSNYLAQRILYQYLQDNDLDQHLVKIKQAYKQQANLMVSMIEAHFPPAVDYTQPEGGMFLWLSLPSEISSLELFEVAARLKVAFVPGLPFYIDGGGHNTLRLNFSNANDEKIRLGMQRLAEAMQHVQQKGELTYV